MNIVFFPSTGVQDFSQQITVQMDEVESGATGKHRMPNSYGVIPPTVRYGTVPSTYRYISPQTLQRSLNYDHTDPSSIS